ncbi:MAG TPA: hypothetical protein VE871_01420 [Longimicrobium sp.]|nr:hypothetical protein [Longimicrobium sp.]
MHTLTLQAVVAGLHLLFAVLALAIARSLAPSERVFRYGWTLTGATFVIRSLNMGGHAAFAIVAFRSGPGSRLWDAALPVHQVMNHSRTFLLTAYCLALGFALVRAQRNKPLPAMGTAVAVVLAGMVVGGLVGLQEGGFSGLTHFTAVAVLDVMELLALLSLLFLGLTTGAMDRGLWASLGVNAFVLSLSVLWFASLSQIDVVGQWSPRPFHVHLSKALLYAMMLGIALRQLRRVRGGKRVRAFLESDARRAMPSLHG